MLDTKKRKKGELPNVWKSYINLSYQLLWQKRNKKQGKKGAFVLKEKRELWDWMSSFLTAQWQHQMGFSDGNTNQHVRKSITLSAFCFIYVSILNNGLDFLLKLHGMPLFWTRFTYVVLAFCTSLFLHFSVAQFASCL